MSWLKHNGCRLALGITAARYGNDRVLTLKEIGPSDLLAHRDQAFWDGVRVGALPPDLSALEILLEPGENDGPDRMNGFFLKMGNGRHSFRRHFGKSTLVDVLAQSLTGLVKQDVLKSDDDYDYFLTTRPAGEAVVEGSSPIRAKTHTDAFSFETAPLRDYLQKSDELEGPTAKQLAIEGKESKQMPVFVPADVWQEGHELARVGGEEESAAVMTGRLFRDTDSPEVFLVIDAFLQAEFAAEEKFSVTFSGDTWGQVRARLEQRRKRLNRPNEIIVGSVHGHNFQPQADEQGRKTCDACHLLAVCSRSTAMASTDDFQWHRSHFSGFPFAQLLLWGWNARDEEEWRMYGLQDASLKPRTVRKLKT